jgi:outer membrane lipoprotein carrier protein
MKYIIPVIFLFFSAVAVGQKAGIIKDPKATANLQKIKKEFDSAKTMEVLFDLSMEYPGDQVEKQKGTLLQAGKKYHVTTDQFTIISDNKTVWFVNKSNKEGQINNASADDGFSLFSPVELLKIYEKEDHSYAITNEFNEKGKAFIQIEFTPLDKSVDYFKARLTIEKATNAVQEVKFFYRDGSRLTLKVNAISKNKEIPATKFAFKKADFPGVHMEDLRM